MKNTGYHQNISETYYIMAEQGMAGKIYYYHPDHQSSACYKLCTATHRVATGSTPPDPSQRPQRPPLQENVERAVVLQRKDTPRATRTEISSPMFPFCLVRHQHPLSITLIPRFSRSCTYRRRWRIQMMHLISLTLTNITPNQITILLCFYTIIYVSRYRTRPAKYLAAVKHLNTQNHHVTSTISIYSTTHITSTQCDN